MNKVKLLLVISILLLTASIGYSATPFTAPAVFDLSGTKVYLEAYIEIPIIGKVNVTINPNPVPIQGEFVVETMNDAGHFSGYGEGNGSTSVKAGNYIQFTAQGKAGGTATGDFDFPNNKVTFYTNDAWAKITVSGTDYDFDIDDGNVTGSFDGKYMRFESSGDESFPLLGFNFVIHHEITAIGELKAAESLEAFIGTNKSTYTSGDQFNTTIGFKRVGKQITVDAWLVLIDPAGTLLFFPGFTTTVANIPNLALPANSELYDVPLFSQILPGATPPISGAGSYIIAFGFSKHGTTDFYSIASKQFTYNQ